MAIPKSEINAAYLHSNSTSHTWVFSAFAEMIDNAYDPDVKATEISIDKVDIGKNTCLIFEDNGSGMNKDKLHKMLSFGYCDKHKYDTIGKHQPIGNYGNGFKSGSMRIGLDALVLTICRNSACIGFFSQTYHNAINAETVFVPIVEYCWPQLECCESPEAQNSLEAILTHSVFRDEGELKAQLQAMKESGKKTKIIISNLKRLKDGKFELHFPHDEKDICCPETGMSSEEQSTPKYKHSLREYCSILYLKPSMRIIIRGEKVQTKLISKSLSHSVEDKFKPNWLKDPVKITIGFACEKGRGQDYGLMLYHKNRLIKAYERVGYQKQAGNRGIGVVGVAAVDFLQPIHNKQDFTMDEKYYSVIRAFGLKLNDYWNEMMNCDSPSSSQSSSDLPDWTWANCDKCLKWRRLPDSVNPETLPAKWYCWNNHDTKHNNCEIPEEPEDETAAPQFKILRKENKNQRKRRSTEASPSTTPNKKSTVPRETGEPGPSYTASRQTHFQSKSQTLLDSVADSKHQECHKNKNRKKGLITASDTMDREKPDNKGRISSSMSVEAENHGIHKTKRMQGDSIPRSAPHDLKQSAHVWKMSTANTKEVAHSHISYHEAANSLNHTCETNSQQQSDVIAGTKNLASASKKLNCTQKSGVKNKIKFSSAKNTDQANIEKVVDGLKSPDQLLELQALHSKLNKFHRNVYRMMHMLHPDIHLEDIANIEEVVEDMLKCPDKLLKLQTPLSQPNEFHKNVHRMLQLLRPDIHPGDIANIGEVVEDMLKSPDKLLKLQTPLSQPNEFHKNVYKLLRLLRPDVHFVDLANIETVLDDIIKNPDQVSELLSPHSKLDKLSRRFYKLIELLFPNSKLGNVGDIEQIVEDLILFHE